MYVCVLSLIPRASRHPVFHRLQCAANNEKLDSGKALEQGYVYRSVPQIHTPPLFATLALVPNVGGGA